MLVNVRISLSKHHLSHIELSIKVDSTLKQPHITQAIFSFWRKEKWFRRLRRWSYCWVTCCGWLDVCSAFIQHSGKLTMQLKKPMFNREYILKGSIFPEQCSFTRGTLWRSYCCWFWVDFCFFNHVLTVWYVFPKENILIYCFIVESMVKTA